MDVVALSNLLDTARAKEEEQCSKYLDDEAAGRGSHVVITGQNDETIEAGKTNTGNCRDDEDDDEVWGADEVPHADAVDHIMQDDRPEPQHEVYYRQFLGTEDVFFSGGSEKSSHSSTCSHVVVKAHFPGCSTAKNLILEVTPKRLKVESRFE
jgi:hypothetical protein